MQRLTYSLLFALLSLPMLLVSQGLRYHQMPVISSAEYVRQIPIEYEEHFTTNVLIEGIPTCLIVDSGAPGVVVKGSIHRTDGHATGLFGSFRFDREALTLQWQDEQSMTCPALVSDDIKFSGKNQGVWNPLFDQSGLVLMQFGEGLISYFPQGTYLPSGHVPSVSFRLSSTAHLWHIQMMVAGELRTFIIDTGSNISMFYDRSKALNSEDVAINDITMQSETFRMASVEVSLNGKTIEHPFVLLDSPEALQATLPADGLLGSDFLSKFDVAFDLSNQQLYLFEKSTESFTSTRLASLIVHTSK